MMTAQALVNSIFTESDVLQAIPNRRGILPDSHDCVDEECTQEQHYGTSDEGYCLVCGGCFDWECCQHDDGCFPKEEI